MNISAIGENHHGRISRSQQSCRSPLPLVWFSSTVDESSSTDSMSSSGSSSSTLSELCCKEQIPPVEHRPLKRIWCDCKFDCECEEGQEEECSCSDIVENIRQNRGEIHLSSSDESSGRRRRRRRRKKGSSSDCACSSKLTVVTNGSGTSSRRSSGRGDKNFLLKEAPPNRGIDIIVTDPDNRTFTALKSKEMTSTTRKGRWPTPTPSSADQTYHLPPDPYYTFFNWHHTEGTKILSSKIPREVPVDVPSDMETQQSKMMTTKEPFAGAFQFRLPSDNLPQYIENIVVTSRDLHKPQHDPTLMKKLSKCIILPEDPEDPAAFTVTPGFTRTPKAPWCSSKPVQKIVGTFAILMTFALVFAIFYVNWYSDTFRPMM